MGVGGGGFDNPNPPKPKKKIASPFSFKTPKKPKPGPTTAKKRGPTSERDSINALLSLGRDLPEQEGDGEDGQSHSELHNPPKPVPPPRIVPSKKRQKKAANVMMANAQMGYKYPEDFWYWLPPGESVGEWDVLCGRGGETNNFIGNRKYRKIVNERKAAYREVTLKQLKAKTAFVRNIVQHVNNCGGRFVDFDDVMGQYYVVTMEKARKKTSQALRETKELKWLGLSSEPKESKPTAAKDTICPYCKRPGHKTKIAKACLKHNEWLEANAANATKFAEQQEVKVFEMTNTNGLGQQGNGQPAVLSHYSAWKEFSDTEETNDMTTTTTEEEAIKGVGASVMVAKQGPSQPVVSVQWSATPDIDAVDDQMRTHVSLQSRKYCNMHAV
jgi:hypothetical protein